MKKRGTKSKLGFSMPCFVFQIIPWDWKHLTNRKVQGKKVFWHVILHTCATLCVSFSSKSQIMNVAPKHILKPKARDQSNQARKKLICHVITKNHLSNVLWSKSKPEVLCKKTTLKNFAVSTGNTCVGKYFKKICRPLDLQLY